MQLSVQLAGHMQEDGAREKELLGTEIALSDAMRFKGAAPEIINGRLSSESRLCIVNACCIGAIPAGSEDGCIHDLLGDV